MIDRDSYRFRLAIIQEIRRFFTARGYLETDTPLLAASCIPESTIPLFTTTRRDPWGGDELLHLLPSPEYYMKQLLSEGWGDIFQIAKAFRNGENMGRIHGSEFTMLEYYGVGIDYLGSLNLTEDLIRSVAISVTLPSGGTGAPVQPMERPFGRITMAEAFSRYAGIELSSIIADENPEPSEGDRRAAADVCQSLGLAWERDDSWETLFNRIFLNLVEPRLESEEQPLFLMDYPAKLQSLSKNRPGTPWTERWELYWKGIELANCFTEENNPVEVSRFFDAESAAMAELVNSGLEATRADSHFAEKIRNLPQCSGTAMGVDRLIMILGGFSSIAETSIAMQ